MERILGILLILGITISFIKLIINSYKLRTKLNKSEEENPDKKEFYRITKSKIFGTANKNDDNKLIIFIIALIIIALSIFGMFIAYEHDINNNLIQFGTIVVAVLLLSVLTMIPIFEKIKYTKYAYKFLSNKYGFIQKQPKIPKRIIYGKKTEVGNIRNNYLFSYKILKYNCTLTNFKQEKLIKILSSSIEHTHYKYKYQPFKNIFEYKYNLNELGVKNISAETLENQTIKSIINELARTKLFNNITINENYLIIEKEIVFGYTKEDLNRDINDVELFYNKIVKSILESEQKNGMARP